MRIYFDTSIGIEGYAIAEYPYDGPEAVLQSIARRTGEHAKGIVLVRNVWVTIYAPDGQTVHV